MKVSLAAAAAALILIPAAATAQDSAKPREQGVETGDGNRMICRTSLVTGSRVKAGRVCMTAEEWAETKRNNRALIEQAQQQRPTHDD